LQNTADTKVLSLPSEQLIEIALLYASDVRWMQNPFNLEKGLAECVAGKELTEFA
jgi:hypothetical protein